MTQPAPMRGMQGKDYLKTLTHDAIKRAYDEVEASFSRIGDLAASTVLERHARLSGVYTEISGPLLGRYRSEVGLVAKRSPRGKAPAPVDHPLYADTPREEIDQRMGLAPNLAPPESLIQATLPLLAPELQERFVSAVERIAAGVEQFSKCAWADFKRTHGGVAASDPEAVERPS